MIATDQKTARAYAKLLATITGEKAVVVLSDDAGASGTHRRVRRLDSALDGRGPDGLRGRRHPPAGRRRLRHQRLHAALLRAGDRPVRPGAPTGRDRERVPAERAAPARAGQRDGGRSATTCSAHARRRFDDELLERAQQSEQASDELTKQFEALSATAELDQVIFDGASFGMPVQAGTPEEEEYLGLPGLLSPDQVALLLHRRQAETVRAAAGRRSGQPKGTRGRRAG